METTPGAEPVPARKEPAGGARRLRLYARPVLIGGIVLAVVGAVLLLVVTGLDAFNATVYSVGGKSIGDATAEAQSLRDQFQGARAIGLAVLIVGAIAIVGSAIALYATRSLVAEDDGDDLGYDELAGE